MVVPLHGWLHMVDSVVPARLGPLSSNVCLTIDA